MASVVKESSSNVFVNLNDQLGGLVLKEEQKLAVEVLLPLVLGNPLYIKAL